MGDPLEVRRFLVDATWQSSLLLLFGLILSRRLAARPARAHFLLAGTMIAAVLTPPLAVLVRIAGLGLLPRGPAQVGTSTTGSALAGSWPLAFTEGVSPESLILAAWGVLSVFLLTRLARSLFSARRLASSPRGRRSPELEGHARRAARELGLAVRPIVVVTPEVDGPVIFGFGQRPAIYIPPRCMGLESRISGVLLHELAHWARGDHWSDLTGRLAVCLLPWNPLAWIARRRLVPLAEHACDHWVLRSEFEATTYAELLLDLAPGGQAGLTLAATSSGRALRSRVERILEGNPRSALVGRAWSRLAILILALGAPALAFAQRTEATPPIPERDAAREAPVVLAPPVSWEPGTRPPGESSGEPTPFNVLSMPHELRLDPAPAGATQTGTIWLVNHGPVPRRVIAVRPTCGCTTVTPVEDRWLSPGESLAVDVSMTAPGEPGASKTKHLKIAVEGQPLFRVPVHLSASAEHNGP